MANDEAVLYYANAWDDTYKWEHTCEYDEEEWEVRSRDIPDLDTQKADLVRSQDYLGAAEVKKKSDAMFGSGAAATCPTVVAGESGTG